MSLFSFFFKRKSSQHSAFICNDALPPLQISPFPGGLIYVKSQTSPMAVLKCSEWRLCAPGFCQRHNPLCNCSLWESTSQWNHLQVHGAVSEEWVDFLGNGCEGGGFHCNPVSLVKQVINSNLRKSITAWIRGVYSTHSCWYLWAARPCRLRKSANKKRS